MSEQLIRLQRRLRADLVKRGRRLEYFTIVYNSLEGLVALGAGLVAGSIALVGFGFDSLIEVTSGGVLLWRLYSDANVESIAAPSWPIPNKRSCVLIFPACH